MISRSVVSRGAVSYLRQFKRMCQQQTRILPLRSFIKEVRETNKFAKIGCLDYGMKCIGLAKTDETKMFTFPSGQIFLKQPPKTQDSLLDLHRQLQEYSVQENIRYFTVLCFWWDVLWSHSLLPYTLLHNSSYSNFETVVCVIMNRIHNNFSDTTNFHLIFQIFCGWISAETTY